MTCAGMYSNCHLFVEWDSIEFEQWEEKDGIPHHARYCFVPLAMGQTPAFEAPDLT